MAERRVGARVGKLAAVVADAATALGASVGELPAAGLFVVEVAAACVFDGRAVGTAVLLGAADGGELALRSASATARLPRTSTTDITA